MYEHSLRRPAGVVIATTLDGLTVEADTNQCVHCGGHWIVEKGSGKPHAYCRNCGGHTCSNLRCLTSCEPFEKRSDDAVKKAGRIILP